MSCLSLRLPPAKEAWKSFTSSLQIRLHKLHYKAIKKPKNRLYAAKISSNRVLRFRQHRNYLFKKKAGPVYIDYLFKEPLAAAELVVQNPPGAKNMMLIDQQAIAPGTCNINVKEEKASATAADDMWESLALASPQMNGIDQRAEEFIRSFRADMELQEMIARRL